jgi:hypothetical protein
MKKKSLAFILTALILGALIGSALGEVLAYIIPDGVVKQFFLKSATASFEPTTINIIILTITVGFSIKINIIGIIGVLIAAYALRWID